MFDLRPRAADQPPQSFHSTGAAWLKRRSPRQVNNQPTQSAVCGRIHANKAFNYSLQDKARNLQLQPVNYNKSLAF